MTGPNLQEIVRTEGHTKWHQGYKVRKVQTEKLEKTKDVFSSIENILLVLGDMSKTFWLISILNRKLKNDTNNQIVQNEKYTLKPQKHHWNLQNIKITTNHKNVSKTSKMTKVP